MILSQWDLGLFGVNYRTELNRWMSFNEIWHQDFIWGNHHNPMIIGR